MHTWYTTTPVDRNELREHCSDQRTCCLWKKSGALRWRRAEGEAGRGGAACLSCMSLAACWRVWRCRAWPYSRSAALLATHHFRSHTRLTPCIKVAGLHQGVTPGLYQKLYNPFTAGGLHQAVYTMRFTTRLTPGGFTPGGLHHEVYNRRLAPGAFTRGGSHHEVYTMKFTPGAAALSAGGVQRKRAVLPEGTAGGPRGVQPPAWQRTPLVCNLTSLVVAHVGCHTTKGGAHPAGI